MKLKDLIIEKKDDTIRVQGVGIFTYKTLKIKTYTSSLRIQRKYTQKLINFLIVFIIKEPTDQPIQTIGS